MHISSLKFLEISSDIIALYRMEILFKHLAI